MMCSNVLIARRERAQSRTRDERGQFAHEKTQIKTDLHGNSIFRVRITAIRSKNKTRID